MVVEEIQVEVIENFPLTNAIYLIDAYKETLKTIEIITIGPYSHDNMEKTLESSV